MKTYRKPTKIELLMNLFQEVGDCYTWEEVKQITGIRSYTSLRTSLYHLRSMKRIPEEYRMDIRIREGELVRVN